MSAGFSNSRNGGVSRKHYKVFGIKPRQTVCSFCHKEAGEMFSLHPLLDKAVCGECAEKVNNVLNTRLIFRQYFYKK